MAPNRRPEAEAPRHETSSEEEDDSEDDDSGSSSEEEAQHQPQHTTASASKTPQPAPVSSDSDSEYETDSDSGPPPTATTTTRRPDPNIKPIASKPMQPSPKSTKKPKSDPTPSTPPPKSAAASVKRPAAESNGALDSKRAKKKQKEKDVTAVINNSNNNNNNETTPKKVLFQRLWSEDDEIVILKGLLDFKAKKGYDPMSDLNVFHNFIKKSLRSGEVSQSQFSTKLRRLKKKFENNVKRGKDGFSKPHEQQTYDLSKKIWGGESDAKKGNGKESNEKSDAKKGNGKESNGKGSSGADEERGERVEEGANAGAKWAIGLDLGVEEVVIKDVLELISESKKLEMTEKWRQLKVEEVELYLKRLDLILEQGKLVLEALKRH